MTNYTDNKSLIDELWAEIEQYYSGKKRYYHTLQHLENVLTQLIEVKEQIKKWEIILFTLYYHDVIYNALKSDNEEKSAQLAELRMKQIGLKNGMIEQCKLQILATKKHLISIDSDTNYFTDADLSVLGQSWEIYVIYYENVRKEYAIYPDFIYNPGRKKVLNHFLQMENIFKTDYFRTKFDKQAKLNMSQEINSLK